MEPLRLLSFSFALSFLIIFFSTDPTVASPGLHQHQQQQPVASSAPSAPQLLVSSNPSATLPVSSGSQQQQPQLVSTVRPAKKGKRRGRGRGRGRAFSSPIAAAPTDDVEALNKICSSTRYPDVCINSIKPLLIKGKTDPFSVLEIAIKASVEQARTATEAIAKLSSEPGTPPKTVSRLRDCNGSYKDALYSFQSAMDALPAKDLGTVKTMLSAAMTHFGDCDDEFLKGTDSTTISSSVNGRNLTQMVSNCLAIANLVH